jgi:uroporphyrinogen-III decarboxylase
VYETSVERLIDEVAEIRNSTRNIHLKNMWENFYRHKDPQRIPVTVNWSLSFYAQTLGIDLNAMFSTPQRYLKDMLKIILYRARNFTDDNPVGVMFPGAEAFEITADQQGELMVYFGPPFEPSFFGLDAIFDEKIDPRQNPNPIIKNESDLDDMNYPDFYQSGMMPKAIEFYEEICKIVKGRLEVVFPIFCRGPFSIAWALRGLQNCVVDMYRRPDFFHRMMKFITESRIRWEKERERYLGRSMRRAQLDNDEVDGDIISKQLYEKFMFPYEEKIAEFYENGIFYFHSCGNLTRLYDSIARLPGLGRIEISPVSDLEAATRTFGPRNIILHKRLDPRKEVYVNTDEMASNLRRIIQQCSDASVEIDACPLDPPTERIQEWIRIARQVTSEYRRGTAGTG